MTILYILLYVSFRYILFYFLYMIIISIIIINIDSKIRTSVAALYITFTKYIIYIYIPVYYM